MQTIAVETLRSWLNEGRPVSIVDVRRKLPATPANYQRIVALNEQGVLPNEPATELEVGANRCAIS